MEPSGNPPVDLDGFRSAMQDMGVEKIVEPILAVYVEEAKSVFSNLSAAVSSGDVETIRATSHALKSSSGNIWARDLAALLQELEIAAQDGDLSRATQIFDGVKPMYDAGEIKEIRNYCETDVLNTYLVYLRYMLHCNDLTKESYNKAIADVITYIDAEKEARPHLGAFAEAWGETCDNKFLLS